MKVGQGQFSVVVREENSDLVTKIIDIDSQRAPHSYKAEIAALRLLAHHKNVIDALDITVAKAQIEPECKIEMPYYELTLENVLLKNSKASFPPGSGWRNAMPVERAKEITAGLANALAWVHQHGVIHRDVKPENVLFKTVDSEPVLCDFGIAWVPDYGEDPKVCDVSTGLYKAPELLLGMDYNEAIDIWALGCVFAKLLAPTSQALFAPYQGDIALLGSQLCVLGKPDLSKCPSLDPARVEHLSPTQDLSSQLNSLRGCHEEVKRMLSWEPTLRPTSEEVKSLLQ